MDAGTKTLFETIFEQAQVFDFDFSHWDRWVRLVVFADLAGPDFNARGTFHKVDFVDVMELHWRTNHLGIVLDEPGRHFQWTIFKRSVVSVEGHLEISLTGFGSAPALEMVCRDVQISEMSVQTLSALNPNWRKPYQPLARPDIEGLLNLQDAKVRRGQH